MTAALLAELTSVNEGVGGPGPGGDVSGLAAAESPLSALSAAGFDDVRQLVSFLDQPLQQLAGNPGSVSTTAQDLQATEEKLSSLAGSYRSSLSTQTSDWSGTAADAYRDTATQQADGIAALGQATSALSSAISEGGVAVAQTAQGVRQDITDAVSQMLTILTQARAQAAATHGASMAAAIPQCVQIAIACAQHIAARLRALLSTAQNLKSAVDRTATAADQVKQAFQPTTPGNTGADPTASHTTDQQSTSDSGAYSADPATNPSTQTSAASSSVDDLPTDGGTVTSTDSNNSTGPSSASIASTPTSTTTTSHYGGMSQVSPLSARLSGLGADSVTSIGPRITSSVGIPADDEDSSERTSASRTAARGTANERMLGGAGLTGAGARRQEDKEHRRTLPTLPEDSAGVFDPDAPAAPAVIDAPPDPDQEFITPMRRRTPVAQAAAEVVPATAPVTEDDAAQPVKLVWRLSESGKLEMVPEEPTPDPPSEPAG